MSLDSMGLRRLRRVPVTLAALSALSTLSCSSSSGLPDGGSTTPTAAPPLAGKPHRVGSDGGTEPSGDASALVGELVCDANECLGDDGNCYGPCAQGHCEAPPLAGNCGPSSPGDISCCLASNGDAGSPTGSELDGGYGVDGATCSADIASAERVTFETTISGPTSKTVVVVQGPVVLHGWEDGCLSDCASSSTGCSETDVPACYVWISSNQCEDFATPEWTLDSLFPNGSSGGYGYGFVYHDMPLADNEALCVTVHDSATAAVAGWGAKAPAHTPKIVATGRVPLTTTISGNPTLSTSIAVGPLTLQFWVFECGAPCAGSSTGCDTTNVPECDYWLGTSDCSDSPTLASSLATQYPLGSFNVVTPTYDGLTLGPGEALCATAKNSAVVTSYGWALDTSLSSGNSVGTPFLSATPVSDRVHVDVEVSGTSNAAYTQTLFEGPIIPQQIFSGCLEGCSSTSSGCMGLTPECLFWRSTSGCEDTPPGVFSFVPAGDDFSYGLGAYNGDPLAAGESLCATVTDTATALVMGWALKAPVGAPSPVTSAACLPPPLSAADRLSFDVTTSEMVTTVSVIDGPATVSSLQFDCEGACGFTGCGSNVPSCSVWLGKSPCTDGGPRGATFDYLYPAVAGPGSAGLPLSGFPLEAGESLCITAEHGATAMGYGWGSKPGQPSLRSSRELLAFNLSTATEETMSVLDGPAVIKNLLYSCSATCQSSSQGCSGVVPECHLWLSGSSCADSAHAPFDFDTLFPLATESLDLGVSGEVYGEFPLASGESLCVEVMNSAALQLDGWALHE